MKLVAGVSATPGASGGGAMLGQPRNSEMSTVSMDGFDMARMNKLFSRYGCKPPHWKEVIYAARHGSSIVGFQMQQLAKVQAMVPPVPEFEWRPGKWVDACSYQAEDPQEQLAIDIAIMQWAGFRSSSGNQGVAIKQTAEVYGSVGEGYGIEHLGRNGKPAVSVVHCQAVEVQKDGSIKWKRRENGAAEIVPRQSYERLFREDETYVEDCTSPWRHLVNDLICFELINAALKRTATSDGLLRGLVWAPTDGPNATKSWVTGYQDMIDDIIRDPDGAVGALMPYPVVGGINPPQHIDFGSSITDGLIKLHELFVKIIARGSVWPAKLVEDGPGAGNAYADHALNRQFLQNTVMPDLVQYVYPDLECWWWHPKLDANPQFRGTGVQSCRFRLKGDIARIADRPDSRKELLDSIKCGIQWSDRVIAEAFGRNEDDLLQPGTPEFERRLESVLLFRADEPNESGPPSAPDIGGGVPESDGFTLGNPTGPRFAELGAIW